jgi:Domain of unknown function (DUF4129)
MDVSRNHGALRVPVNPCILYGLFVLFLFGATPASGQSSSPASGAPHSTTAYDVASFETELDRISDLLQKKTGPSEMTALGESLPDRWTVATPEKNYSISTEFLRGQLRTNSEKSAQAWVDHLRRELENYSATPPQGTADSRAELDGILGGAEFAAVHPPTSWDLFRQRLAAWIERLLLRLFGSLARYPLGGYILFWVVVVLGVGIVALWVFRFMVSRDRIDSLSPGQIIHPVRTWQEWLQAARAAANTNDFREAIHSAYWAGITRLEDTGILPRDRTKTPREYLLLVSQPAPRERASHAAYREPLTVLTSRLERTWYGSRAANFDDFRDTLRQLEALGCQLE